MTPVHLWIVYQVFGAVAGDQFINYRVSLTKVTRCFTSCPFFYFIVWLHW